MTVADGNPRQISRINGFFLAVSDLRASSDLRCCGGECSCIYLFNFSGRGGRGGLLGDFARRFPFSREYLNEGGAAVVFGETS